MQTTKVKPPLMTKLSLMKAYSMTVGNNLCYKVVMNESFTKNFTDYPFKPWQSHGWSPLKTKCIADLQKI